MLKPQHRYLLEIIKALSDEGEQTVGGLQRILSKRLDSKKDFYTLKSACRLLELLGFLHVIEKGRFTFVGLSDEGKRMADVSDT